MAKTKMQRIFEFEFIDYEVELNEKPKILILDDDDVFLETQKELFESLGAIVERANNFESADKLMDENSFDFIFVDYKFRNSKMNGASYIDSKIPMLENTKVAMITGVAYNQLLASDVIQKHDFIELKKQEDIDLIRETKFVVLRKGAGWVEKTTQIIEIIKEKIKEDKFNSKFKQFAVEFEKKFDGNVKIKVKEKEESSAQEQMKQLFFKYLATVPNQQKNTFIFLGKKWSAEMLYHEIENPDSKVGTMVMGLFFDYLDYSVERMKRGRKI